jgi:serralysin
MQPGHPPPQAHIERVSRQPLSNLSFTAAGTDDAVLRFGQSVGWVDSNGTVRTDTAAHAWIPFNGAPAEGDVWFNPAYGSRSPVAGNYAWFTHLHEIGHGLGLKHPHEPIDLPDGTFNTTVLPAALDSIQYTVMSYKGINGAGFNLTESGGFPSTYMALDILTLQIIYGWDNATRVGNNIYTWSPTTGEMSVDGIGQGAPGINRVFLTVYDAGGIDTYNMSNYTNNVIIDLRSGAYSTTSEAQKSVLNVLTGEKALGNVFNSISPVNETRYLIENGIGGSGNDSVNGNEANNRLEGRAGGDTLWGFGGNDTLDGGDASDRLNGGDGNDSMVAGGASDYDFVYGEFGDDTIIGDSGAGYFDAGPGNDSIVGGSGAEQIIAETGADFVDAGGGNDTIWGGDGYTQAQDENDTILGGIGNDYAVGSYGNDSILGGDGNDTILGWNDNDFVSGGAGNDVVRGDHGQDTMEGGAGADSFAFAQWDFGPGGGPDLILDFSKAQADKIDLWIIDPDLARNGDQSFGFIGTSDFGARGKAEVRYYYSGGQTIVELDGGDGIADHVIQINGTIALARGDFIL